MANNIFPASRANFGVAGGIAMFLDPKLSQRAQVFDLNGAPLPGNVIVVSGKLLPEFQSAASILYTRDPEGGVVTLQPSGQRTAIVVTGAKGGNAALTSLIAALVQIGYIVDQTS